MDSTQIVFYILATLIACSSVMVVASRAPVISALFLVLDLFLLACVYATLNAHFVAVIQVLVYAGAILVLFLFVIMLLNEERKRTKPRIKLLDGVLIALVLTAFLYVLYRVASHYLPPLNLEPSAGSNTEAVGKLLFVEYLWAFELASFLILLAMVASIIITKKSSAQATEAQATEAQATQAQAMQAVDAAVTATTSTNVVVNKQISERPHES